jgi:cytochrome c oxidase cbb3-type subunit 3
MFGWSTDVYNEERLERKDIADIIDFMRQQEKIRQDYIYPGSNPGDKTSGQTLFRQRCAECHGEQGEGKEAPALNNQEFLSAASNGYLVATLTIGREGTRMPSWGYSNDEYPMLSGKERQDIAAYIRSWQRIRIKY